jgi:hypothetical protein
VTTERATTRAAGWPSALALGAVALAVVLAAHGEPLGADRWLRELVRDHVPDRSQPLSTLLSQLGSGAVL